MTGMPPQGGMPQGMPPQGVPPQVMQRVMPASQPGGEGVGLRTPRGPASPERRATAGSGSPVSSVQQRGGDPTLAQNVSNALIDSRRPRGA